MLLSGFFDESERQDGSEPITLGGYIFKPSGYKHFCRKWRRMLETAGPKPTSHFHMTNLYARTYEYAGWSVDERAEVLRQAVDALQKHAYFGVCVLISQSEFEQLAPPHWRIQFGSIYSAVCQLALNATGFWMDNRGRHESIAYAFESGHRFWDEANGLLTGIGKHPTLQVKCRYHSHTAIPKERAYGLQAADLLAWTFARLRVGAPRNQTMTAFAPIIMDLVEGRSDRYQLLYLKGDTLQRFFDEQNAAGPMFLADTKKARKFRLR
jgi:hypothetical protein